MLLLRRTHFGVIMVPQQSRYVMERLGKFHRTLVIIVGAKYLSMQALTSYSYVYGLGAWPFFCNSLDRQNRLRSLPQGKHILRGKTKRYSSREQISSFNIIQIESISLLKKIKNKTFLFYFYLQRSPKIMCCSLLAGCCTGA